MRLLAPLLNFCSPPVLSSNMSAHDDEKKSSVEAVTRDANDQLETTPVFEAAHKEVRLCAQSRDVDVD